MAAAVPLCAAGGTHEHEGRLLQPGDVVQLTEAQATNWADKFEPMAAESVSA